ncbi:MAG: hypothetical protein ABIA67_05905 [Candidatus Margulisiibacteriota bacterium]
MPIIGEQLSYLNKQYRTGVPAVARERRQRNSESQILRDNYFTAQTGPEYLRAIDIARHGEDVALRREAITYLRQFVLPKIENISADAWVKVEGRDVPLLWFNTGNLELFEGMGTIDRLYQWGDNLKRGDDFRRLQMIKLMRKQLLVKVNLVDVLETWLIINQAAKLSGRDESLKMPDKATIEAVVSSPANRANPLRLLTGIEYRRDGSLVGSGEDLEPLKLTGDNWFAVYSFAHPEHPMAKGAVDREDNFSAVFEIVGLSKMRDQTDPDEPKLELADGY